MKGRVGAARGGKGGGANSTDLLVCFPARSHLALMPKSICSPQHAVETRKRLPSHPNTHRGRASPLFKAKEVKQVPYSDIAEEPTSPKVTCAGQIKIRPKPKSRTGPGGDGDSKNWVSVVEEIERLRKQRKKITWLEALGLKKDAWPFLGALRSLRLNMRCFGSFHDATVGCSSDEEDVDEENAEDEEEKEREGGTSSTAVFSKWFMVLEENQTSADPCKKEEEAGQEEEQQEEKEDQCSKPSSVPPPNALLLMRCRSAPAKGWLKREAEEPGKEQDMTAKFNKENDEEEEEERLLFMSYTPDFFKLSMDIAKETWIVGGGDPLARSRSWKR